MPLRDPLVSRTPPLSYEDGAHRACYYIYDWARSITTMNFVDDLIFGFMGPYRSSVFVAMMPRPIPRPAYGLDGGALRRYCHLQRWRLRASLTWTCALVVMCVMAPGVPSVRPTSSTDIGCEYNNGTLLQRITELQATDISSSRMMS